MESSFGNLLSKIEQRQSRLIEALEQEEKTIDQLSATLKNDLSDLLNNVSDTLKKDMIQHEQELKREAEKQLSRAIRELSKQTEREIKKRLEQIDRAIDLGEMHEREVEIEQIRAKAQKQGKILALLLPTALIIVAILAGIIGYQMHQSPKIPADKVVTAQDGTKWVRIKDIR